METVRSIGLARLAARLFRLLALFRTPSSRSPIHEAYADNNNTSMTTTHSLDFLTDSWNYLLTIVRLGGFPLFMALDGSGNEYAIAKSIRYHSKASLTVLGTTCYVFNPILLAVYLPLFAIDYRHIHIYMKYLASIIIRTFFYQSQNHLTIFFFLTLGPLTDDRGGLVSEKDHGRVASISLILILFMRMMELVASGQPAATSLSSLKPLNFWPTLLSYTHTTPVLNYAISQKDLD